MEQYIIFTYNI